MRDWWQDHVIAWTLAFALAFFPTITSVRVALALSPQIQATVLDYVQPAPATSVVLPLTYQSSATSTLQTIAIGYTGLTWASGCNSLGVGVQWYSNVAGAATIAAVVDTTSLQSFTPVASAASANTGGIVSSDAWQLNAPTGTSGTITVTYSAAPSYDSAIAVYCLVSANTASTAAAVAFQGSATSVNQSIVVQTGGTALIQSGSQSGLPITLTNGTIDVAISPGGRGIYFLFGHTAVGTGASISVTGTVASTQAIDLSLAAYKP